MIKSKLKGFDELTRNLNKYPAISRRIIGDSLRDILVMLAGDASRYPSAPSNSTYRRTGTLGRLWTSATPQVNVSQQRLGGRIGNKTPYGPYVQSSRFQAKVHVGRWRTTEQVIQENLKEIEKELQLANDAIVDKVAKL